MSNASASAACHGRLLIIDDNQAIHGDFRKILLPVRKSVCNTDLLEAELFGDQPADPGAPATAFELTSALQGQEGVELARRGAENGQRFALAFVDMRMPPGWDGVETTQRIWEIDPDVQIVICTAYSDYSWSEMMQKLGHSDRLVILKKPFDPVEVLQLASSLTRKWHLLQESKRKLADLEEIIVRRTAEMMREQAKFRSIFELSPEGIFQIAPEGCFLTANAALAEICGFPNPQSLIERIQNVRQQLFVEPGRFTEFVNRIDAEGVVREFESEVMRPDGSRRWIKLAACKVARLDGALLHYQGFAADITAQKKAQQERNLIEVQLRQAQKLESVGQLAAGIAHEINTPIQYIGDNIRFVEESFATLNGLLRDYARLAGAVQANAVTADLLASVEKEARSVDIEYLCQEIPAAVRQALEGVGHVADIVRAMKEFSHPGVKDKIEVDLNHTIATTITVARNEWKYLANLTTDYAPDLPRVRVLAAEFNQVILNLIVNAAHAIADATGKSEARKGTILISTRKNGDWVEIRISDTGTGIPEAIRGRIFEPFFTTKAVGKGTGQGLAIARSTVVDKHSGEITFESTVGKGTTFVIRLPLDAVQSPASCRVAA